MTYQILNRFSLIQTSLTSPLQPLTSETPDVYSQTDIPSFPPNNIVPNITLNLPTPTGNPEIDERNLDDYYDILQQIRPDAFISEDEDDVDAVINNPDIVIEDDQNTPIPNDDIIIVDGIKNEPDSELEYTPYVDTDGNILVKANKSKKNYIPKVNKTNKIYRDKARKKAILAKIKAARLKNRKEQYKTNVLVPTDATNNEIGNPQVATIIPPQVEVEDDIVSTDDDVDFRVDIANSDDDVKYVKYIPPPPEIPVPPPIHPRDRLKQQLTAPKSPEPMPDQFSDTETVNYLLTAETDDVDVLSDAALSDVETISYLPYLNLRNQI